ncbi:MAG: hypothetical protein Q7U14_12050, partial [Lacisediminimonas sp.]|nr:hypothetical protein [Lacisediminimonas sp.]
DRLMDAVRQYSYLGQYPVTVSAGFATLEAGDLSDNWEQLIRRADIELYKAKGNGRDAFYIASDRSGAAPLTELPIPIQARA